MSEPQLRLEWRDAADLVDNPANWRRHPERQSQALAGVLQEVGWAGALLWNERTGRLIDGHLRKKVAVGKVPVLIGSWSEEQEKLILATLDPLAALAEQDRDKLDALLREVQTGDAAVAEMLTNLAATSGVIPTRLPTDPANDPTAEWQGMPEFEHEDLTAFRTMIVHFADADAVADFASRIGQDFSEQTKFVWHPKQMVNKPGAASYVVDES